MHYLLFNEPNTGQPFSHWSVWFQLNCCVCVCVCVCVCANLLYRLTHDPFWISIVFGTR